MLKAAQRKAADELKRKQDLLEAKVRMVSQMFSAMKYFFSNKTQI